MEYAVTDDVAIHFMGPDVPPVLSTPALVLWMESTSHENLGPLLGPGEDSVGVLVHVRHLAATPLGMRVRVVSKLVKAEGRIYTFEVEAFDESEKIGEGIHERASVAVAKFSERVAAKRLRARMAARTE